MVGGVPKYIVGQGIGFQAICKTSIARGNDQVTQFQVDDVVVVSSCSVAAEGKVDAYWHIATNGIDGLIGDNWLWQDVKCIFGKIGTGAAIGIGVGDYKFAYPGQAWFKGGATDGSAAVGSIQGKSSRQGNSFFAQTGCISGQSQGYGHDADVSRVFTAQRIGDRNCIISCCGNADLGDFLSSIPQEILAT